MTKQAEKPAAEVVEPVEGDLIADAQKAEDKAQKAREKQAEIDAEVVAKWDGLYDSLKSIKLTYEHTPDAAIHRSKLWAVLGSINTADGA